MLRPKSRQCGPTYWPCSTRSDNRLVRVYESPNGSIHSPVFVGPRPRPPVIPSNVSETSRNETNTTGFLYCRDVRFTRKSKADWSRVRMIRVLAAKGLTTRSSHSHIVHAGHETVELGTVPIRTGRVDFGGGAGRHAAWPCRRWTPKDDPN